MKSIHLIKRAGLFLAALVCTFSVTTPSAWAAIVINEYGVTTAGSQPHNLVLGPDGNMWFTEFSANQIGKMAPNGSMIAEYPLAANAHPNAITVGPDGRLWFTEYASPGGSAAIGAITTSGVLSEYALSPSAARPHSIVAGPDGNLWFTEIGGEAISRIQTDGTLLPKFTLAAGSNPYGITVGADGNMWFTEWSANKIVKMNVTGTILQEFSITGGYGEPYAIASGPDGRLWFTLQTGPGTTRAVASITTTGTITYYPTPTASSTPHNIIAAPDGNMWFTELSAHSIAMITPAGVITEYPTPTALSAPFGIAVGPNNTLWFSENNANQIGVVSGLTIPSPAASTPQAPSTGFGAYRPDAVRTLLVSIFAATLLIGLAIASRKVARQYQ